jgi:hypothetical protein
MQRIGLKWVLLGTVAVTADLAAGNASAIRAQEQPRPAAPPTQASLSPRGGNLAKTEHHQFEVFFYKTGLRVFPGDAAGKPLAVSSLTGTATFALPGAPKPFVYPLQGAAPGSGPAPTSLDLGLDLSKVPVSGTKVTLDITGLPDPAEPAATFTLPFVLTGAATTATTTPRRNLPASLTFARSTAADQAAINAQRVCKVSGSALGSMGAPIKVTRGDRVIFLCCQSCIKRVQANPDHYLGSG